MKTYFAKYLPVEEEIKEGDWIIFTNLLGERVPIQWLGGGDEKSRQSMFAYAKKVKMFLCTRDIQVGDKVLHLPDTNPELTFEVMKIEDGVAWIKYLTHPEGKFIGDEREWLVNSLFKVIGEVSPEAIWVKEGDEFDKEEVRCSHIWREGQSCNANNLCTYPNCKKYMVKCPTCQTFH